MEEFGRRVQLVGRPVENELCGNLGLVFETLCKILKYLVELLVSPELEEFGGTVELVGRPDQKRQCVNLGSVFETLCKI